MKTNPQKDTIELTLSWLIFGVTLLLGSILLIPFLQGNASIQEQSDIWAISIMFLVDSLVFFPPLGSPKWLKYTLIGFNFVMFN